jgi:hypothetical protein
MGVAKCMVKAALEPPATIPHSARSEPLRQSAVTRNPDVDPRKGTGERKGRDTELRSGEMASSMIAASLKMSALRRYAFASGKREGPT